MRTLDQIYWDCLCTKECKCKDLEEALIIHEQLKFIRDSKEKENESLS